MFGFVYLTRFSHFIIHVECAVSEWPKACQAVRLGFRRDSDQVILGLCDSFGRICQLVPRPHTSVWKWSALEKLDAFLVSAQIVPGAPG